MCCVLCVICDASCCWTIVDSVISHDTGLLPPPPPAPVNPIGPSLTAAAAPPAPYANMPVYPSVSAAGEFVCVCVRVLMCV